MNRIISFIKKIPMFLALMLIHFYRACLSPLFPGCCRFVPSCSQYSYEAISKYGFTKGLKLTIKRFLKCHPGGPHGYDPVP